MPSLIAQTARIPRLSRFAWLMGLYAENHARLSRLFAPAGLAPGGYRSVVGDGLDLQLDVLEQHRYTTELRLTYALRDPLTGEPDPSAYLRLYHDARQLEATHCYVGRRWQDVIGMYPPPARVVGHRLRMNTFLGKWLEYLAERGHGVATLRPVDGGTASGDGTKDLAASA
ncbi:DUF1249 domain-containing protein [Vulcaniibacterium tengchongense]|uniref:DUF1249 domain-containing protein n=1 Tax=Vulcaniibacterium tengchongense TaxID=1273429 RepID=A0A3N4VG45_9GAMM|nr:DUF1249 domain-containing protein [Vulcaniibacterium tengchongense]RPE81678.1 hypothetical protein EDC50_0873 [Vulcaniibacterium tengchongense]